MDRRFVTLAALVGLAFLSLGGCSAPTEAPGGNTTTTTTTGGDTTGATTGGETPSTTADPEPPKVDEPLPAKPKDGEEVAVLETSKGRIVLMFYPQKAPNHVSNFIMLAKKGFYNGTRFHRCIPGFMIQGGDPNSKDMAKAPEWGTGGNKDASGKEVNVLAEFNDIKHTRGILSMARSQSPDSASSQFFIMVAESPQLDGQYTAFGKAVSGMDVADKIVVTGDPNANGLVEPKNAIVLKSVTITKWPVK